MSTILRTALTTTILGLGGVLLAAPASAQESAPPASEADSDNSLIIVTARGREETLLDVPVSVTTYDSAAIEDANISRTDDFIALTPGVTFSNAQDAGTEPVGRRQLLLCATGA